MIIDINVDKNVFVPFDSRNNLSKSLDVFSHEKPRIQLQLSEQVLENVNQRYTSKAHKIVEEKSLEGKNKDSKA
jgi:hypothetical protein